MALEVELAPRALEDLQSIVLYVAERADFATAEAYAGRIRVACMRLADFPDRGTPRDDLIPGLRTISFERKAVIAYRTEANAVVILRILHHGRESGRAFENP